MSCVSSDGEVSKKQIMKDKTAKEDSVYDVVDVSELRSVKQMSSLRASTIITADETVLSGVKVGTPRSSLTEKA